MTIHPGAQTQTLADDTIAMARAPPLVVITAMDNSQARKTSLLQAPKRTPLSNVLRPSTNTLLVDVAGCPTGKENSTPFTQSSIKKGQTSSASEYFLKSQHPLPKTLTKSKSPPSKAQSESVGLRDSKATSGLRASFERSRAPEFEVLGEDLIYPELFESGWLTHQEASLTQIVNAIFDQANLSLPSSSSENASYRPALLKSYQQSRFLELHRRLRTSVTNGALSLPRCSVVPRIRDDVSLRRKFVDIWMDAYQMEVLWIAAEVISARVCKKPTQNRTESGQKGSRKLLGRFLDSILVTCDQAGIGGTDGRLKQEPTIQFLAWQQTVVRSLMIIKFLDHTFHERKSQGCLFQASSPYKSSEAVLRAVGSVILPSVGDISRTLGYLGYNLSHSQTELQEYSYHISNIATDLRDGVLLARIVELLMYGNEQREDGTISVTLPTGGSLESLLDHKVWPLSQHLNYPCPTRQQKLFNVQVSLSALETASGLTQSAISTTSAADIVDGHRERTLSCLWAVIARWGLHMLVPIVSLQAEIKRHSHHLSHGQSVALGTMADPEVDDAVRGTLPDEISILLKAWAATICTSHGVAISNLTTSFATPAALTAIVDAYSACIPRQKADLWERKGAGLQPRESALQEKLRAIGCSSAFVNLFSTDTRIPTKATTLCLLAFLASRLIPLSRRLRAAETLQRAWRLRLGRLQVRRRIVALRLAHQCAEVVIARQRVERAVLVMQKAWKTMKQERMRRAEKRIEGFQAVAKAWATRRALAGVLPQLRKQNERARGGW
ncbi:hypothetical protein ANO11243_011620 [Dothideomycetidae sp. 11243]|nr:hypothetical protein ANO11243_011620 [fungal sp. No.11243]